jgi:hypothetical protein
VVIEAVHLCMLVRGVGKQNSRTITSARRSRLTLRIHTRGDILGELCELVLGYDQRRVIDVDAEAFARATLIP